MRAFAQALLLEQAGDLVGLAAQPDHQHAGEVGVARIAAQRAAQDLQRLAVAGRRAAGAVGERDHAVAAHRLYHRLRQKHCKPHEAQ